MIKSWLFEFLHAPEDPDAEVDPRSVAETMARGLDRWQNLEALGYEGIFFSEHHFGISYSSAPNLLIAAIANRTKTLRLGTMGMVLPFYQPWRVLEEIAILDQLTGGRLEIGCASGVPQELIQIGMEMTEVRERFDEALEIIDAGLTSPVISHRGKYWNFENLKVLPRPLQQPAPPKWTTVVSVGSARKSAARGSKVSTAFHSVERAREVFDAYRDEAERHGVPSGPDQLGLRRTVTVAESEAEAKEIEERARAASLKIRAGDPRIGTEKTDLMDAPKDEKGFTVHDDDFVTGTPRQVAEQIVEHCRAVGAGHFLAILGRGVAAGAREMPLLYGEEVIPLLERAETPGG